MEGMENKAAALISSSALDPSRTIFSQTIPDYRLPELTAAEAARLSIVSEAVRSSLSVYSPFIEMTRSAEALQGLNDSFLTNFRLADQTEAFLLATTAMSNFSYQVVSQGALDTIELCDRMAAMTCPWIDVSRSTASIRAFTDFQTMGIFANSAGPYEEAASKFFRERLGDWRDTDLTALEDDEDLSGNCEQRSAAYAGRGVDLTLTNFTEEALDESLDLAGLPRTPLLKGRALALVSSESIDFNTAIFRALLTFELEVRAFLSLVLGREFGPNWINTQVPPAILEQWHNKKDRAFKNGEPKCSLVEYADFSDYIAIIVKKQNWNAVFSKVFVRQQDIQETMARLSPVRIQTMHARMLTLEDDMLLRVETGRFYSATQRFIAKL
ncbi:hypothetical protein BKM17_06850 [Pseudomonas syringae group genomosp. 3]|nr:hypothetical protein BKM17_06850 [Pseudomonas syringae group genomosp. 3]